MITLPISVTACSPSIELPSNVSTMIQMHLMFCFADHHCKIPCKSKFSKDTIYGEYIWRERARRSSSLKQECGTGSGCFGRIRFTKMRSDPDPVFEIWSHSVWSRKIFVYLSGSLCYLYYLWDNLMTFICL